MRWLIMNHTMPDIDESVFRQDNWMDFYGKVVEEDPPNMPVPLGNPVQMSCLWTQTMQATKLPDNHTLEYLFYLIIPP